MSQTYKTVPEPQALLQAWMPFKEMLGVTSVHTEDDYARARAIIEVLLDTCCDDENHPLADVLDYLSDQVETYEEEHCVIPESEPKEVLRFLMEQHGLRQNDLADCAPQSRISDILNGRREISKGLAKKLAQRFSVSATLFL
ncbi:MAG: helix-turn-helix domain-containing protein [Acidobacteriota bacterium]|nr:helix-turn-helix domain-containing protein [Acidobacteriota bacterium]